MRYFLKTCFVLLLALLMLLACLAIWLWPRYDYLPAVPPGFELQRFDGNPVVSSALAESLSAAQSEGGYANINGPSVIRVPRWLEQPLGKYYLYFAHHKGNHIRMAYGDSPTGPWTLYEPGTLQMADSGFAVDAADLGPNTTLRDLWRTFSIHVVRDYLLLSYQSAVTGPKMRARRGIQEAASASPHIASPEMVVDDEQQRLLMYFHGLGRNGYQSSGIARSTNGVDFTVLDTPVFSTYLRAWQYRGRHYLLGMPGVIYRSDALDSGFEPRDRLLFDPAMRHAAMWVEDTDLHILWSRVGDAPESLLYSRVDMTSEDWNDWRATEGVPVLAPRESWEGADRPVLPSLRGELDLPGHELRDPFVLTDGDGRRYLYYVGAGEQAIGVAILRENPNQGSPD